MLEVHYQASPDFGILKFRDFGKMLSSYFFMLILVLDWCDSGEGAFNESTSAIMDEILTWYIKQDLIDSENKTWWDKVWPKNPCTSEEEIHYYLCPNRNISDCDVLDSDDPESLENARWKKGAPVKILVHGFQNSAKTLMPQIIKDAYLRHEYYSRQEANVIIVDWGCYAMNSEYHLLPIWYRTALKGVPKTGVKIATLMNKILNMKNGAITSPSSFHIIGHSLGAHVAGEAGNTFQSLTEHKSKIGRITGLDPAGPGFTNESWYNPMRYYYGGPYRCVTKDDASLVDIIHTAWGSLGINNDLGHDDFYPNDDVSDSNKQVMPGCESSRWFNWMLSEEISTWSCSHRKAPIYFAVSIIESLRNKLIACGCTAPNYEYTPEIVKRCKDTCHHPCTFGESYTGNCDIHTNFVTVPQGKVSFENPSSVSSW